jgi:hypothetical protein
MIAQSALASAVVALQTLAEIPAAVWQRNALLPGTLCHLLVVGKLIGPAFLKARKPANFGLMCDSFLVAHQMPALRIVLARSPRPPCAGWQC